MSKKKASKGSAIKKGDTVFYYEFGDRTNEPFPIFVSSVNESSNTLTGLVVMNNYSFHAKDLHNIDDPWCEKHQEVLRDKGAWSQTIIDSEA